MGVVWQARDERLHRLVAVKQLLLQPDLSPAETEGARQRALREARIAARLQHPNAIVVYDVAEHDGEPCLVMEYLPSRTLGAVLTERGSLPVAEVASIGKQVASALAAAHAAQIVHRDVKPGNILIADGGTAKITDFGVSRAAGDVTVTQTGMMAGTPAYLAPEVARGQVPTPASDVFSLGATLFAAIEGRAPFGECENQLALLHAVAAGEVAPPQQAGRLTSTLMSLLDKDPQARPDMHQASMALAAAMDTRPVTITPRLGRPPTSAAATLSATLASHPVPQPSAAATPPPPAAPPPADHGAVAAGPPSAASSAVSPSAVSPSAVSPSAVSPSAASPQPQPASAARPAPRADPELRRKVSVLAGVAVLVLALSGVVAVLLGSYRQDGDTTGGSAAAGSAPAATAPPSSSSSPNPSPSVTPTSPAPVPVSQSEGSIAWSDAGQLVIDYYNGLESPASAWQLLSPAARASFGSEAEFQSYWGQYSSISARNAQGVTDNGDGSVTVPVDVTYHTDGGQQTEKRTLRVVRLGGQLLIDSDPR